PQRLIHSRHYIRNLNQDPDRRWRKTEPPQTEGLAIILGALSTRQRPFITSPHLIGLLVVTARLVQEQVASRLTALGISYAQAVVLVRLYRSPTGILSQSDMIESLAVSRASGTLVLGQLQTSELIVRNADPGD